MANDTTEIMDLPVDTTRPTGSGDVSAESSPEEIEKQLQITQANLAGKIGLLEDRTMASIRETLGSVNDTASTVQSFVSDPMAAVQSVIAEPLGNVQREVKNAFSDLADHLDPRDYVVQHPISSVGVAILGGLATGLMVFRSEDNESGQREVKSNSGSVAGLSSAARPAFGYLRSILQQVGTEFEKVSREVIESASQSLVERFRSAMHSNAAELHSQQAAAHNGAGH